MSTYSSGGRPLCILVANAVAIYITPTVFGGDQLTHKRAESAKELRKNSITPTTQLKGLVPVCEDWHAKKAFLEVHVYTVYYVLL